VTGASGAAYARRLAQCLVDRDVTLHLIVSPPARRIMAAELGLEEFSLETFLGKPSDGVTLHAHDDVGAAIASGSCLTAGMVICPCSSHSLGAIAAGLGDNLITRAAMVTLKEHRRLILVPREMPLSPIEIENLLTLSRAGAIICPACPGFYTKPTTIDDLVDFVVSRVLDLLGLAHDLDTRWNPRGQTE
jgi:4-hydroxy-3-polyprenylbenzoate decarboxylase